MHPFKASTDVEDTTANPRFFRLDLDDRWDNKCFLPDGLRMTLPVPVILNRLAAAFLVFNFILLTVHSFNYFGFTNANNVLPAKLIGPSKFPKSIIDSTNRFMTRSPNSV